MMIGGKNQTVENYQLTRRTNVIMWSAVIISFFLVVTVSSDPVYVRSSRFGQLVTSSTLRWFKGIAKDPVTLATEQDSHEIICRVWNTGLRGIGLVSQDKDICNISEEGSLSGSEKFQTISSTASRLIWTPWSRPNPPPTGAVAISVKPQKFIAADMNGTRIGYLDPTEKLGLAVFPSKSGLEQETSCLVLTEVEPIRYELSDIQLKRNKGFIEEDIVLAYGHLQIEEEAADHTDWTLNPMNLGTDGRAKVESILSYETSSYDYWGQGYMMAKGLHTSISLPEGETKTIEWGIPLTQAGKTEMTTAIAHLLPNTGVNVTLRGTKLDGEMSYWGTLKTFFKDGSSSSRLIDGHRKVIQVVNIQLHKSREYFLSNFSYVPEPPTTTTTTSTTTTTESYGDDDEEENSSMESVSAQYPMGNGIQADQSQWLSSNNNNGGVDGNSAPFAKSVAQSHASREQVTRVGLLFTTTIVANILLYAWAFH